MLILDEATSALDETAETSLYAVLNRTLAKAGVISTGHRSSLVRLHDCLVSFADDRAHFAEKAPEH